MHKKLYHTGYIAYLLLFILSMLFYKERAIFMDAAFHVFQIVVNNDFTIQNYRFGAVVTQIFPLLCRKMSVPVDALIMTYSTGIIAYYTFCYFICGTLLRQYAFALLVLAVNILFATDTFFWMHSELPQALTMLVVFFAVLNSQVKKQWLPVKYLSLVILLATVAFFHPLIIFPATFLFLYLLLSKKSGIGNLQLVAVLALFIIAYCVRVYGFKTAYDTQSSDSTKQMWSLLPQFFELYANKQLAKDGMGKFIWMPVFFAATCLYYCYNRKWVLLSLYIIFLASYTYLVNMSYFYSSVPAFYIENMYLPLSIFLATPVIFELLPGTTYPKASIALFLLIILTGAARIYHKHHFYTARLNWERSFLQEHAGEKLIVEEQAIPGHPLIMSWATSYEFWLLSTIEKGKTASILITDHLPDVIPPPGKTKSFITAYGGYPYAMLPAKYFLFTDTITAYRVIPK